MSLIASKSSSSHPARNPGPTRQAAAKIKYAKFSQPFVHANIFRSLIRGERKKPLDVKYEVNDLRYHFVAPALLGVDDMRVLQGLVGLASDQNRNLVSSVDSLDAADEMGHVSSLLAKSVSVRISVNELAREIGYGDDSGGSHSTIRESIKRLYATSVFIEKLGSSKAPAIEAGRIIHTLRGKEQGGLLELSLSPILSAAVLGGTGQFLLLDMAEIRALTADVSRLLHMRLLWINPGKSGTVRIDTLMNYVYHEPSENEDTMRQRRSKVRKALEQLRTQLGWKVDQVDGMYRIGRPARARQKIDGAS